MSSDRCVPVQLNAGSTIRPSFPSTPSQNDRVDSLLVLKKQALRFLAIGGTSVAIDCAVYYALSNVVSPIVAKSISYVAGMIFGYIGNKFWTFESNRRSVSEPLIYALLYAATLAINVGTNWAVYELMTDWQGSAGIAKFVAFLFATGLTTVLNFVGMKFLAFRSTPSPFTLCEPLPTPHS